MVVGGASSCGQGGPEGEEREEDRSSMTGRDWRVNMWSGGQLVAVAWGIRSPLGPHHLIL